MRIMIWEVALLSNAKRERHVNTTLDDPFPHCGRQGSDPQGTGTTPILLSYIHSDTSLKVKSNSPKLSHKTTGTHDQENQVNTAPK